MRQMRIVGSILAVMLLMSACADAPDEEQRNCGFLRTN